jgi:allantoin racemase
MKLLVVNPNTTASMTHKIGLAAQRCASPGTEVFATNPSQGPVSIEGYFDEALCLPGLLQEMARHSDADATVIACFDDTGLDAARCLSPRPVIGIGEAAYKMAAMVSNKFSVVTTLSRSVPALEHNLARYGLSHMCVKVRASDVPVLELESPHSCARDLIRAEIAAAISQDKAEAIVLGCAGMADLAQSLSEEFGVPVLDGVACAVALAEAMVRVGVKTSKVGGYAPPPAIKMPAAWGIQPT